MRNFSLNKICFCFIVIYLLFFLAVSSAYSTYNDEQAVEKATDFLNQGKYLEAIGMYQEISQFSANPNVRARALFFIARTYSLYLDQYDTALKQFESIMKNYPNSPAASDALFNSGMVLFEQGEYKKAYDYFAKYLKTYPKGRYGQSAVVWADSAKSFINTVQSKPLVLEGPIISDDILRVLIKEKANRITIHSNGNLSVLPRHSEKKLYHDSGPISISIKKRAIAVNGQAYNIQSCRIVSDQEISTIDNKPYRGYFTISVDPKGISVVNNIQIEQYLYGVVPKEMPHSWKKQALMAQAVAARTYALHIKEKSKDKPYDVVSTTMSQVYGGYKAETSKTNQAIDETRGEVMTYEGKLIVAYFHSNSGGHTEDPENVWRADVPYLKGVPDEFSQNTPGSSWEYFLSYSDARKLLGKHGLNLGNIDQLNVSGKSNSGRSLEVLITSNNRISRLGSNNFRIKIGGMKLKSTLFQLTPSKNGIQFKGKGFGHGVGMSQWGAYKMAKSGADYKKILKHYYQNIKIAKVENY